MKMFFPFSAVKFYSLCYVFYTVRNGCSRAETTDVNTDAKAIVDSKFDPKTVANILLYRTQEECSAINQAVAKINGDKPLVDPNYVPLQNTKTCDDLVFALVNESMTVYSKYLGQYIDRKDETFIIMIFILIDDREKFKQVYNEQHKKKFDDGVEAQKSPFMNAFRVWSKANRQPSNLNSCVNGQDLVNERSSWNKKKRDDLENVLMKEAIEDSRNSIRCYGTSPCSGPYPNILDDIKHNIENDDLVDLYSSLVSYIQNGNTYQASKLHQYCDGKDGWTMWIIILTTRRGDAMKLIDDEFQKLYNNVTLAEYIKTCQVEDTQLKDMLTVLVDSESAPQRQTPPPPPPEPPCTPTHIHHVHPDLEEHPHPPSYNCFFF